MRDYNLYIAFEGVDGCGKSTQFDMFVEELRKAPMGSLDAIRFPNYENQYGKLIADWLNKESTIELDDPFLVGTMYALNQYQTLELDSQEADVLITDRSPWSNFIYQYERIPKEDPAKRHAFLKYLISLYQDLHIKMPDIVFTFPVDYATSVVNAVKGIDNKEYKKTPTQLDNIESDSDLMLSVAYDYKRLDVFINGIDGPKWMNSKVIPIQCYDEIINPCSGEVKKKDLRSPKEIHESVMKAMTVIELADIAENALIKNYSEYEYNRVPMKYQGLLPGDIRDIFYYTMTKRNEGKLWQ